MPIVAGKIINVSLNRQILAHLLHNTWKSKQVNLYEVFFGFSIFGFGYDVVVTLSLLKGNDIVMFNGWILLGLLIFKFI